MRYCLIPLIGTAALASCSNQGTLEKDEIPATQLALASQYKTSIEEAAQGCLDDPRSINLKLFPSSESRWQHITGDQSRSSFVWDAWIDTKRQHFEIFTAVGDLKGTSAASPEVIYCIAESLDLPVEREVVSRAWNPVSLRMVVRDFPSSDDPASGVSFKLTMSGDEAEFQSQRDLGRES
ncbi:hypothetical protein [Parerythrobacter jejuensis]|uniref:Lipoprotein n=1 Tax=Parerythrobacter jejuensis TaxID=795812 RepID=A0A845AT07_9SPHN|nr:hypothetical protein [Parerythrobacter jejuensis]MXP32283.1 hypothetical protein [Parerythrobacter jejuensis]